ncbi:MAG: helix-turn-helix transcriptional regulator [Dehalococcoidales bacterium]|nr:helix-turn-helix transcriptional regulator [Dehalococcoidales bacterium]
MDFGSKLRALRLAADLTQRELARRSEIDFTYLSKIEAGIVAAPSDEKVRALGAALGLSAEDMTGLVELAQQTRVPTEVVKAALIRNPGVGALLRRLKDQRLSDEQIEAMLRIAQGDSKATERGDPDDAPGS